MGFDNGEMEKKQKRRRISACDMGLRELEGNTFRRGEKEKLLRDIFGTKVCPGCICTTVYVPESSY